MTKVAFDTIRRRESDDASLLPSSDYWGYSHQFHNLQDLSNL